MSVRAQIAALPEPIADAATAARVLGQYREGDILACATAMASGCGANGVTAREAFRLLTILLSAAGARGQEPGKAQRSFEVQRPASSATNVLSVDFESKDLVVKVHVLSESWARDKAREARDAFFCRLTRRPIANNNDPEPRFRHSWLDHNNPPPASFSPGLQQRTTLKGRLAEIVRAKRARLESGAWRDMPGVSDG